MVGGGGPSCVRDRWVGDAQFLCKLVGGGGWARNVCDGQGGGWTNFAYRRTMGGGWISNFAARLEHVHVVLHVLHTSTEISTFLEHQFQQGFHMLFAFLKEDFQQIRKIAKLYK